MLHAAIVAAPLVPADGQNDVARGGVFSTAVVRTGTSAAGVAPPTTLDSDGRSWRL